MMEKLDCEQSLFCSKIRAERARARATRDSPLAARRSKISLAHARYFRFVQHGF